MLIKFAFSSIANCKLCCTDNDRSVCISAWLRDVKQCAICLCAHSGTPYHLMLIKKASPPAHRYLQQPRSKTRTACHDVQSFLSHHKAIVAMTFAMQLSLQKIVPE